jgi:hypothetical protein
MTEVVSQNGVDCVRWQVKSFFQAQQGVSRKESAENSLLEMFRIGW